MPRLTRTRHRRGLLILLWAVIVFQLICVSFILYDLAISTFVLSAAPIPWHLHELLEIAATFGLVLGLAFGIGMLRVTLRRATRAEEQLRGLSGAFQDLLEERFADWGLTAAERDVAWFTIKGLSNAEIAALRETSEGTVKAQTNAIYRKAGVTGRPQLLSVFLEDLLDDVLPAQGEGPAPQPQNANHSP
ncbi:MAG: helix-turn-helix transcriptional regulator [Pseudomonadota bacterium]